MQEMKKRKFNVIGKIFVVFLLAAVFFISFITSALAVGSGDTSGKMYTTVYPAPLVQATIPLNSSDILRDYTFSLDQTPQLFRTYDNIDQSDPYLNYETFYQYNELYALKSGNAYHEYTLPMLSVYSLDSSNEDAFYGGLNTGKFNYLVKSVATIGGIDITRYPSTAELPGVRSFAFIGEQEYSITAPQGFVYRKGTSLPYFCFTPPAYYLEEYTSYYSIYGYMKTVYQIVENGSLATYTYKQDINAGFNSTSSRIYYFNIPTAHLNADYIKVVSSDIYLRYTPSLTDQYYLSSINYVDWYTPRSFKANIYDNTNLSLQDVYQEKYMEYIASEDGVLVERWHNITDITSWIGDTVGSFFDLEILPGFKLGAVMGILLAITMTTILLKLFAGG